MVAVLILAAGQGTRMVSDLPKILHPLGGKAMVHHVMDAALALQLNEEPVVVISPTLRVEDVQGGRGVKTVVQSQPLGTGHAVKIGMEGFAKVPETVLVLCGDTPLLEPDMLTVVVNHHKSHPAPCLTVVGMRPQNPGAYGRIVTDGSTGQIERIIEYRDASEAEQALSLCNSGIILADGAALKRLVSQLSSQNKAGEYYLTDVVALARQAGIPSWVVELPAAPLQGINTRVDLAAATHLLQQRWRQRFMEQGVTLVDPSSVFFSHDTRIGRDVTIRPNVTFGEGVTLGNHVHILPGCHIENATLGNNVTVGPFAHLRGGALLGNHVSIGNFVEVKKTTLGDHTKAKHLAYLGDATIGEKVNIGAGTITCNHNGFLKSQTVIGDEAYIGSDSCLVAPVSVGAGAIVAAGSVVDTDVPDNALAIGRQHQENKLNWATHFRARHQQEKK